MGGGEGAEEVEEDGDRMKSGEADEEEKEDK